MTAAFLSLPIFLSNVLVSGISQRLLRAPYVFCPPPSFHYFLDSRGLMHCNLFIAFQPILVTILPDALLSRLWPGGSLPISCVSLDKSQDGPGSRGRPTPAAQAPKKEKGKSGLWPRGDEHM